MVGVAQADGEDRHVPLGGDRGRLAGVRLLVVAVGDQQDRLVAVGAGLEDLEGLADRVADGRAAPRGAVGVELVERAAEGVVIDGQRALHHRLPGEGDQAHALPFEPVDEGRHVGLGAAEPAGGDVLGEHRPRDVDQDVEVAPPGDDVFILRAEPRPRQRDEAGHQGRLAQEGLHPEPGRRIGGQDPRPHRPGHERLRGPPPPAPGIERQRQPGRPQRQDQVQPLRMLPFHRGPDLCLYGNERNRVSVQDADEEDQRQPRHGEPGERAPGIPSTSSPRTPIFSSLSISA